MKSHSRTRRRTLQLALDKSLRSIDEQNGHMTVERSYISKANVCEYLGREIPGAEAMGLDPEKRYRMLRHPDELRAAAESFSNLPLLVKHVPINAEAPARELWVGTTGTVTYEHPYLVSRPLKVWTAEAIDLIHSGEQRELSSGYGYVADMTPGNYEGQAYDGIMRQIRGNHVAIVSEGRVGPDVSVADQALEPMHMNSASARIVAAAIKPFLAPKADTKALALALDKALGEVEGETIQLDESEMEAAEDEFCKAEGKAKDEMSEEDKEEAYSRARDKKAKDMKARDSEGKEGEDRKGKDAKGKDMKARDRKHGRDEEVDHRKDFESAKDSAITQDQLNAATRAAADLARREMRELQTAQEDVRPIVGLITLDSADEIYRYALKHAGVDTTDIKELPALRSLVSLIKSRKPAAPDAAALAMDTASSGLSVSDIWAPQA